MRCFVSNPGINRKYSRTLERDLCPITLTSCLGAFVAKMFKEFWRVASEIEQDMYSVRGMDGDIYPIKYFAQHTYTGRSRKLHCYNELRYEISLSFLICQIYLYLEKIAREKLDLIEKIVSLHESLLLMGIIQRLFYLTFPNRF